MSKQTGFTLIELLVVIAIIGILASVVMVSLNDARAGSRNAARVAQIKEYQKALALFYADHGRYPYFGSGACPATQEICLGDYPPVGATSGSCWGTGGNSKLERAVFQADLVEKGYLGQVPVGDTQSLGNGFVGMTYTETNSCQSYTIKYYLEGLNKKCVGGVAGTNEGADTFCTLSDQ